MSRPFFSVIVPAHNSEAFIRRGLRSIREQTFTDYELIVVCDECSDNTAKAVEHYADKVITTHYGMDGLARNEGIDAADGYWILFMDDDDWYLHPEAFRILRDAAVYTDADMIVYNFIWQGWDDPYYRNGFGRVNIAVWSKCWRRDFIGSTRFPAIPFTSDEPFMQEILSKKPRAIYLDQPLYYYNYLRKGSQTEIHNREGGRTDEQRTGDPDGLPADRHGDRDA